MATATPVQPSACDVLDSIRRAARELDAWAAHVEAYLAHQQPGQALAAARSAGIVTATLEAAACDTRSVARTAEEAAFWDAA